ncbi:hypothetical protein K438DRAFT_1774346 [Mycena galopus ATCC 62051]|nr:hypothetical protein K438DRAFT_1774346 [Mycena galopus ATCC 62051]
MDIDDSRKLHTGYRQIRNIQVVQQDLESLASKSRQKIPGTALDAFGASLYATREEMDGPQDWCFFASWLAVLASGKGKGKGLGTVDEHIFAATREATSDSILARSKWIIPLCGGCPLHWILAWVDYASKEIGIFDSIPELGSSSWGEPLFLLTLDMIRQRIGVPQIIWDSGQWNRRLVSPSELERQLDGWSCGIFVGMGIKAMADGGRESDWAMVGDSRKNETRQLMLEAVSSLPVIARVCKSKVAATDEEEGSKVREPGLGRDNTLEDTNMSVSVESESAALAADAGSPIIRDESRAASAPVFLEDITYDNQIKNLAKRKHPDSNDNEDVSSEDSEKPQQKRPKNNTANEKTRGPRLSERDRRKALEDDSWCLTVEVARIRCGGCRDWIKLNPKRAYDAKNWLSHKNNCSKIRGFKVERVSLVSKKPVAPPKGVPGISTFFGNKAKAEPIHTGSSSNAVSVSDGSEWKAKLLRLPTYLVPEPHLQIPRQKFLRKKVPPPAPLERPCLHLRGDEYHEYILRTQTRSLGGVSLVLRARATRQLTPWKKHPDTAGVRKTKDSRGVFAMPISGTDIPEGCNEHIEYQNWTAKEKKMLDEVLGAWARWEVNYTDAFIRSPSCCGKTTNTNLICDACLNVTHDESFKRAVREKNEEGKKSTEEQQKIAAQRAKYAHSTMPAYEANKLKGLFADPVIYDVYMELERGEDLTCFLKLYKHAADGKLKDKEVFVDLCKVMADQVQRHSSNNPNLKFGIRYPHAIKYSGPVAVAGDCTKVRPRLTYSNDFGSHILGSTLALSECEIDDENDIDDVISKIKKKKAVASQVRAILIKIPLPEHPPMVVALIPTTGKDDAEGIHELQLKLLKMAANLNMQVVSFAADGAAAELAAQGLLDNYQNSTLSPPVTYTNSKYGISLRAPVFPVTGPVTSISDPPHGKKTCKNQNQYGTHTASLGKGFITYRILIMLYHTGLAGLKKKDVEDSDKQDDGAARRLFYSLVFTAMSEEIPESPGDLRIKEEFMGLFVYLWVFGTLFDAWMSRTMSIHDRILAAFRARFWLHLWRKHIVKLSGRFPDLYSPARSFISPASFHIFNRLCDTLILLAIIYSRYYPGQPFCPWLHGTEFVEHFFGLARMLLPNFTFAEFLKMVQHMEVRQKILLSGKFNLKRERDSAAGYIMDYDAKALSSEDQRIAAGQVDDRDLDQLAELAFREAAQICKEILHIAAPFPTVEKPLQLTPLGSSLRKKKTGTMPTDSELESDLDNDSDVDEEVDCDSEDEEPEIRSDASISEITAAATLDTARYSALCQDYDTFRAELGEPLADADVSSLIPKAASIAPAKPSGPFVSKILDAQGKVSIKLMVNYKKALQAGTTTHSERVVSLNPKFALAQVAREADTEGKVPAMSIKEASHRVRIAQDGDSAFREGKKTRELRWQTAATTVQSLVPPTVLPNVGSKNVNVLFPIRLGNFLVMRTTQCMYIGEVMDIFKKGSNGRYGSIESAASTSEIHAFSLRVYLPLQTMIPDVDESDDDDHANLDIPKFSCVANGAKYHLHTYALAPTLLYHLGPNVLSSVAPVNSESPQGSLMGLTGQAGARWMALSRKDVAKALPPLKIKVPGGRAEGGGKKARK